MGVLPAPVLAASTTQRVPTDGPKNLNQFIGIIENVAKVLYNVLIALGVVFILYAAFLYMISQGDETRLATAKRVLIYAIVALVIGVLAGGVHSLVKDAVLSP